MTQSLRRSSLLGLTVAACAGIGMSALALSTDAGAALAADAKVPTVSKSVGKQLQAAQKASQAKNWAECLSQAHAAEAVSGRAPYDDYIINELLGFCEIRTQAYAEAAKHLEANVGSQYLEQDQLPQRIRALSQINYQLKNYAKAIEFGNRAIKGGYADAELYTLVAQAYYIQGDYKGTLKFVSDWVEEQDKKGQASKEQTLQLLLSSCVKLKDDKCTTTALEKLVARYPKDEYWQNLMQSLFRTGGGDKSMLNVYRLAAEVNAMRAEYYTEMAQISMEQGLPGEAQSVLEQAFSKKVFTEQRDQDRNNRLLATAKTQATTDKPTLPKQEKEAAALKTGEADVKIGTAYMSYGQFPQAVAAIQRGIAKGGLKSAPEAQLMLGIAQLRGGSKSDAIASFKAVKGDETLARVANLWMLHAQQM
jgi:tetratricopeptide (TPR) repeat protein